MRWIFNSKRWVSTCFNYKIKTSFSNENVVTNPKKGFESEQKGMRTNTPEGFDLEEKSVGAYKENPLRRKRIVPNLRIPKDGR